MRKIVRIAVDGPSGSGKSTIAKKIAKELGIDYIDTGAMYRALGYKMLCETISVQQLEQVKEMLAKTEIDFLGGNILLDGICVNDKIRTSEVSKMASLCSTIAEVRDKLVTLQRRMGQSKSIIMDGRDIATNVLTDAEYKFFLTATPQERALRRWKELKKKGENLSLKDVEADMIQRDYNDTTRKLNPLRKDQDALELDTTGMSIDDVVSAILKLIK